MPVQDTTCTWLVQLQPRLAETHLLVMRWSSTLQSNRKIINLFLTQRVSENKYVACRPVSSAVQGASDAAFTGRWDVAARLSVASHPAGPGSVGRPIGDPPTNFYPLSKFFIHFTVLIAFSVQVLSYCHMAGWHSPLFRDRPLGPKSTQAAAL